LIAEREKVLEILERSSVSGCVNYEVFENSVVPQMESLRIFSLAIVDSIQ
jgi:hypothetical protein